MNNNQKRRTNIFNRVYMTSQYLWIASINVINHMFWFKTTTKNSSQVFFFAELEKLFLIFLFLYTNKLIQVIFFKNFVVSLSIKKKCSVIVLIKKSWNYCYYYSSLFSVVVNVDMVDGVFPANIGFSPTKFSFN